jgi:hypothetical protein
MVIRKSESGFAVILLSFAMIPVLLGTTWAFLEFAMHEAEKQARQTIIDAGVITGIINGRKPSANIQNITELVNASIQQNALSNSVEILNADLTVTAEEFGTSGFAKFITVRNNYNYDFNFMRAIDWNPFSLRVSVKSKGYIPLLAVTLVLDMSHSMNQNPTSPTNSTLRSVTVKKAAQDFIDYLRVGQDYYSFVRFSNGASVSNQMALLTDINEKKKRINLAPVAGLTNYEDAFTKALSQNDPLDGGSIIPQGAEKIVLFVSDGAPSTNKGFSKDNPINSPRFSSCTAEPYTSKKIDHIQEYLSLRAISAADALRAVGGATIHTISIGTNIGYGQYLLQPNIYQDPYQGTLSKPEIADTDPIRSNLLARIANDYHFQYDFNDNGEIDDDDLDLDGVRDDEDDRNVPDFNETCVKTFEEVGSQKVGSHQETDDAEKLTQLLANAIQMHAPKLVE